MADHADRLSPVMGQTRAVLWTQPGRVEVGPSAPRSARQSRPNCDPSPRLDERAGLHETSRQVEPLRERDTLAILEAELGSQPAQIGVVITTKLDEIHEEDVTGSAGCREGKAASCLVLSTSPIHQHCKGVTISSPWQWRRHNPKLADRSRTNKYIEQAMNVS